MIVRTGLLDVVVEYEDATFNMRELSTKEEADIAVTGTTSPGAAVKMKFVKAVTSWGNVNDSNGTLFCDEKNKGIVFDSNQALAEDVLRLYIDAISAKREDEKKILKSGQPGTSSGNTEVATHANA